MKRQSWWSQCSRGIPHFRGRWRAGKKLAGAVAIGWATAWLSFARQPEELWERPRPRDLEGYSSAVALAIAADDVERLEALLPPGSNLDRGTRWEGTRPRFGVGLRADRHPPVAIAVETGATNALRWLLERGANADGTSEGGISHVHLALNLPMRRDRRAHVTMADRIWTIRDREGLRLLLAHGANPFNRGSGRRDPDDPGLPLYVPAHNRVVFDAVLTNANAHAVRDDLGNTLLHVAVCESRHEAVAELLRSKLSATETNCAGWTPLQLALLTAGRPWDDSRDLPVAELLIAAGDRPDVWIAAALGWIPLLEELGAVDRARLAAPDRLGRTPLHCAILRGRSETAGWLLDQGVPVDVADRSGDTPLHGAVRKGLSGLARRLIQAGADIRARNQAGETPLKAGDPR